MEPGTLIASKYRLTRLLGRGAMGVVWAATNERTEGQVALKLIPPSSPELKERLLREARACGRLDHRNVIAIYDVGETDAGDPFLVMPLLTGETLADRIRRESPMPPAVAAQLAFDIGRALHAAHSAGIVHRDLKPANVFLHREADADGATVKVLDFGVSKMLSAEDAAATITSGVVGSPLYMSPEQTRGDRDLDARADLWAVGVLLFEMLTGVKPFYADSPYSLMTEILSGKIPTVTSFAPDVDPELSALIGACLTRDPKARLGTAAELLGRLRPFVPGKRRLSIGEERAIRRAMTVAFPGRRPEVPRPSHDDESTSLYRRPEAAADDTVPEVSSEVTSEEIIEEISASSVLEASAPSGSVVEPSSPKVETPSRTAVLTPESMGALRKEASGDWARPLADDHPEATSQAGYPAGRAPRATLSTSTSPLLHKTERPPAPDLDQPFPPQKSRRGVWLVLGGALVVGGALSVFAASSEGPERSPASATSEAESAAPEVFSAEAPAAETSVEAPTGEVLPPEAAPVDAGADGLSAEPAPTLANAPAPPKPVAKAPQPKPAAPAPAPAPTGKAIIRETPF